MIQGEHNQYWWFISHEHQLHDLLQGCAGIFVGRFLAITSFDSGPLKPSNEERATGWVTEADVLYSPRLTSCESLPHDGYDEWYLFDGPVRFEPEDVFVNYGGFSLEDPRSGLEQIGETADLVGRDHLVSIWQKRDDLFWRQLERLQPVLYVAEGDLLVIACTQELYGAVLQCLSQQAPNTPHAP
jgi:hypothetical protein